MLFREPTPFLLLLIFVRRIRKVVQSDDDVCGEGGVMEAMWIEYSFQHTLLTNKKAHANRMGFCICSRTMLFIDNDLGAEGLGARTSEEAFGEDRVDLAGREGDGRQGEGHG